MSSSFELPKNADLVPLADQLVTMQEGSLIGRALNGCKQILGRGALALSLVGGAVTGTAIEMATPHPTPAAAASFTNDYPNMDAELHSASNYEWWIDENGDGKKQIKAGANDELMSARGFDYRNCTDGVAHWIMKYTGVAIPSSWGSAKTWDTAATSYTVKEGNSNSIEPGDIAQSDDGTWGHVGLVVAVNKDDNGTVTSFETAELNEHGDGNYTGPGAAETNSYNSKNAEHKFKRSSTMDWDHFIDVNGADKGLNNEPIGADTDGDGVKDSSDTCPTVYGWTVDGCPVRSDFNRDRRADVAAFYRYNGNSVNLWNWNGYADGNVSPPGAPWAGAGWDGTRIIPAGSGDFNDDHKQDIAAFYRHNNGMLDLNIWYGDGNGSFFLVRGWHVPSQWEGERLIPAGVGDYNKDGKDDIAAFYRYDQGFVNLWIWNGQDNEYTSEPRVEWSGPGWDGNRIMPVGVSDTNKDKKPDIVTFYKHDNGAMDMNIWLGNGAGGFDLTRPWAVGSLWEGPRLTPAGTGDFDHDGYGDVAAFYRYDDGSLNLWAWWGQPGATMSAPTVAWTANGWDATRIMPAGVANYNGDDKQDIATFYKHDNGMMDMNLWFYNGGHMLVLHRAWHAPNSWEGERLTPAKP